MMKQTRKTRIRIPAWPLNSFGNSRHGFFAKNIQLAHIHGQAYGAKKSSRWYCVHHLPFEVQPDSSTLFLFQHLLLYRYMDIPLFSCAPSLLPRALTHGLSRALKMWPTRRIIVQFIFTLVRFIAATKFHFTSSTADANFEHDLISAGFRVVHRVNTTRKLSRLLLPPLSTRSSFALLSRRLLVEETRWCDVSRAIGSWSPQIHVLLERVRDRKTRKTRKKKKNIFQEGTFLNSTSVSKNRLVAVTRRRQRHKNVFSFLFCIFVSALADLLAPTCDYFKIKINYHSRSGIRAPIKAIRTAVVARTHPASLLTRFSRCFLWWRRCTFLATI